MEEKIKEDIVEVMIGKIGHEFETLTQDQIKNFLSELKELN